MLFGPFSLNLTSEALKFGEERTHTQALMPVPHCCAQLQEDIRNETPLTTSEQLGSSG